MFKIFGSFLTALAMLAFGAGGAMAQDEGGKGHKPGAHGQHHPRHHGRGKHHPRHHGKHHKKGDHGKRDHKKHGK